MKLRRGLAPTHEGNVNVTPLIDVVMVLIVFFMLVAKIGISTGAEQMNLPATISGIDIKDLGNTLTLNVRPGPAQDPIVTTLVNGQKQELKLVDSAGKRPLLETLRFFRYGANQKDAKDDNPEFKVIIRAERDTTYRFIEPVLLTCAEAHVKNVNFNTAKVLQEVH